MRNREGEKINVRQAGDICAVAPEGHELTETYYIELKHVKKLALDQFIIKGTGPLANFWKIAAREAEKHNKCPVIIARQNGWPDLVIAYSDTFHTDRNNVQLMCEVFGKDGNICIATLSSILESESNFED